MRTEERRLRRERDERELLMMRCYDGRPMQPNERAPETGWHAATRAQSPDTRDKVAWSDAPVRWCLQACTISDADKESFVSFSLLSAM